jgi:two-component system, OmpR family, KDP operon response regulator KdpE
MGECGPRALIVDDEVAVRRFLRTVLTAHNYEVFEAATGQDAVSAVKNNRPDVIILDLGLPDIDGIEVTKLLRAWTKAPILILSVRGEESAKIAALDEGADDYLTKPFSMGELLARLRAALRRASQSTDEPVFADGDLQVDLEHRLVTVRGREVQLTPTEYDLLRTLVTHAGKVLTHRQLLHEVWGKTASEQDSHLVRVNISNLRHKVELNSARPRYIITEPGVGYRLRIT